MRPSCRVANTLHRSACRGVLVVPTSVSAVELHHTELPTFVGFMAALRHLCITSRHKRKIAASEPPVTHDALLYPPRVLPWRVCETDSAAFRAVGDGGVAGASGGFRQPVLCPVCLTTTPFFYVSTTQAYRCKVGFPPPSSRRPAARRGSRITSGALCPSKRLRLDDRAYRLVYFGRRECFAWMVAHSGI